MSIESLLLILFAFVTNVALTHGVWEGSVAPPNGLLTVSLVGYVTFLAYFILDQRKTPRWAHWQFVVLVVALGGILICFAGRQAGVRRDITSTMYHSDGVAQSVAAATVLMRGTNPYTADFTATNYKIWPSPFGPTVRNLSADHYAYPPLTFLVYVPIVWLQERGWNIDAQLLYLVIFLGIIVLLCFTAKTWTHRNRILILTAGNPFLWAYAFAGYNDTLFVFCLLASLLAFSKRWWIVAGIMFGLALSAKQTVWVLVPLWTLWLWWQYRRHMISVPVLRRMIVSAAATAAAFCLPFVLWNAGAMYDDMIRYVSGTIPYTFPIANTTFAQYLRIFGFVSNPWNTISLWPIQVAALLPTFWFVGRWLRKRLSHSRLLVGSAIVLLVATLFNRVGSENYFLPVIYLSLAAYMYGQSEAPASI